MILNKTDLWTLITLYNLSLNVGRTRHLLLSIRIWQRQWDVISEIIFQKTITPFLLAYFPLLAWMKPVDMLGRLMWHGIESNLSQQAGGNRRWPLASNSQPTKTFSPIGFKDLSSANNHTDLERVPSPFEPWHETWALMDTLIVALRWNSENLCPDSWTTRTLRVNVCYFKPLGLWYFLLCNR